MTHEPAAGQPPTDPDADQAARADGHGHDEHGHEEDRLGPVDWVAWATGALGVAIGLAAAFAFALATGVVAV